MRECKESTSHDGVKIYGQFLAGKHFDPVSIIYIVLFCLVQDCSGVLNNSYTLSIGWKTNKLKLSGNTDYVEHKRDCLVVENMDNGNSVRNRLNDLSRMPSQTQQRFDSEPSPSGRGFQKLHRNHPIVRGRGAFNVVAL